MCVCVCARTCAQERERERERRETFQVRNIVKCLFEDFVSNSGFEH